jgi:hypothetical protein
MSFALTIIRKVMLFTSGFAIFSPKSLQLEVEK